MNDNEYYFEEFVRKYMTYISGNDCSLMSIESVIKSAQDHSVDIHFLKRLSNPRIIWAVNKIKGLRPATLLDIGSGKGYILWYINEILKDTELTAIDISPKQVSRLQMVAKTANLPLKAIVSNAQSLPFAKNTFAVTTLLEVLEHTSKPQQVISEVCRVTQKWVLLSVPSKADDNPEHIHLFDRSLLKEMFNIAGATDLRFVQDSMHIYVQAKVS